jgi:hypothetical protein
MSSADDPAPQIKLSAREERAKAAIQKYIAMYGDKLVLQTRWRGPAETHIGRDIALYIVSRQAWDEREARDYHVGPEVENIDPYADAESGDQYVKTVDDNPDPIDPWTCAVDARALALAMHDLYKSPPTCEYNICWLSLIAALARILHE